MRLVFAALLSIAISGCAQSMWVKEGTTDQDFKRDSYECERDARMSSYYGTVFDLLAFENRCMEARGWHMETMS